MDKASALRAARVVRVRAREIAVIDQDDREHAQAPTERIMGLVHATWGRRGEIQPSAARRQRPKVLEV